MYLCVCVCSVVYTYFLPLQCTLIKENRSRVIRNVHPQGRRIYSYDWAFRLRACASIAHRPLYVSSPRAELRRQTAVWRRCILSRLVRLRHVDRRFTSRAECVDSSGWKKQTKTLIKKRITWVTEGRKGPNSLRYVYSPNFDFIDTYKEL